MARPQKPGGAGAGGAAAGHRKARGAVMPVRGDATAEDTRREGQPRRESFRAEQRARFTVRELVLVNALFYLQNQRTLWADALREECALARVASR